MLVHLKALGEVVNPLINVVDGWISQKNAQNITPAAQQRGNFLRYELRKIHRLHQQMEGQVPDSVIEASLQQPAFWLRIEADVSDYLDKYPELDIIQINLQREGTEGKLNTHRAILWRPVLLGE